MNVHCQILNLFISLLCTCLRTYLQIMLELVFKLFVYSTNTLFHHLHMMDHNLLKSPSWAI